jgi:hypothetical protein
LPAAAFGLTSCAEAPIGSRLKERDAVTSPPPDEPRSREGEPAHQSYAREAAATADAQARFFREQAERHRSEAGQARTFADLAADADERAAHERRAEHLETLSRHDETIAREITARVKG